MCITKCDGEREFSAFIMATICTRNHYEVCDLEEDQTSKTATPGTHLYLPTANWQGFSIFEMSKLGEFVTASLSNLFAIYI